MQTLADFKRLPINTTLTLTHAIDWDGSDWKNHPKLNKARKIEHVQSNAIRFEGGSWLMYPKATEFTIKDNQIIISDEKSKMQLIYTIN